MAQHRRVRLFRNGRDQVVRIPVEFDLAGDEVIIHRDSDRLVIEPKREEPLSEDFPEIDDPVPTPTRGQL